MLILYHATLLNLFSVLVVFVWSFRVFYRYIITSPVCNDNFTSPYHFDFPGGSDGKASAYNAGDLGSIPGSGRSSGEGNDNPLQYSCLEIPWTQEPGRPQSMGLQKSWT